MVAVSAGLDELPQIWPLFPASRHPMGSQGPVRAATTAWERPTPWISDLTGEDIEPDESGSPTIGCRFLKDAARSPSRDSTKCARCGAQQAPRRRWRETWVARGEWRRSIRPKWAMWE